MVDAQPTTEDMPIDPPLGESDAPLMGNPVLSRGTGRRRRPSGSSSRALQIGVPLAIVVLVLAGGAFYLATGAHQGHPLMTNPGASPAATAPPAEPAPPPPAIASTAPPAAAPAPPAESAPPPTAAPPHARATRLARAERTEVRPERHTAVRRDRAAEESGADVSATESATPAAPPSPPPVITPPPPQ